MPTSSHPQTRSLRLGVTDLRVTHVAHLDFQHWGLAVCSGADAEQWEFYEVAGQGKGTRHMTVVGPKGTVAAAPAAPTENRRSRRGIAGNEDNNGELGYHRIWVVNENCTTKSDEEIERWIEQWVRENPAYDVKGIQGKNCQNFCQDFHRWLTGKPLKWTPQASLAKSSLELGVKGGAKLWVDAGAGVVNHGIGNNAVTAAGNVAVHHCAASVPTGAAGSAFATAAREAAFAGGHEGAMNLAACNAAGGAAVVGGLGPGVAVAGAGMAGQYGGRVAARKVGMGEGSAARVGVVTGLGSATATGAAIGGFLAGPPGALGGAAVGAASKVLGDVVGWGISTIQYNAGLASGESLMLGFLELEMNQTVKFAEESIECKMGVTAIELKGPERWQVLSGKAWNRTLWITTTKGLGVEFETSGGKHGEFTAAGSGYHSKRWWAETDEQAIVTKIRVTVL